MSRRYKFKNPDGVYFITFATVEWLDVFTRNEYREIIIDSLRHCQNNKGLELFSWCLMTNHIHLIARASQEQTLSEILRDFKGFTAKQLIKAIKENPRESRKEFLLEQFEKAGKKTGNVKKYQFWRHDNQPVELWSNHIIDQKLNYIHQNPVEGGLVFKAEDYPYSSAIDYADGKGELEVILIAKNDW